ncbi:MAG: hypothetical protein PVH29_10700 [Candidatus Zixiibacteriota bacterium]|jgi:uncharacterized Zn finger protein (UPF0148 family)
MAEENATPSLCPKCGAALGPADAGKVTCEYCGATLRPEEVKAEEAADSIDDLYERGRAALARRDYSQAYEYFDRITDRIPTEADAWLDKGIAGAYKGLVEDEVVKADEALLRLEKALEVYAGDDRETFERNAANRMGAAAVALYIEADRRGLVNEVNVRGILDLLIFWEASGSAKTAAWEKIIQIAAEFQTPEGGRPYAAEAEKYAEILKKKKEADARRAREKAEAEAEAAAPAAPAEEKPEPVKAPSGKGKKTALIIGIIVVAVVVICILCCVMLAIFGSY